MGMHYELWHMPSGNLVKTFDHESDALALVRRSFQQSGQEVGESFALGTEDRRGRSRQIAAGAELLARAITSDEEHLPRQA